MANIAERIYHDLSPEEAVETLLAKMEGRYLTYFRTDKYLRWRMWHKETKTLKFKKGGKISFTNGWMNQQYNW